MRVVPLMLACALVVAGCQKNDATAADTSATSSPAKGAINEQSPELAKVGYSAGFMLASGMKEQAKDLDIDAFDKGFRDAYAGKTPSLTEAQMQEAMVAYEGKMRERLQQEMTAKAATNLEAGNKWLAENAKKEGVKTTASGLQYKIISEGTGKSPAPKNVVQVNYEGKLLDGTVFDKSEGAPVEFPLSGVIPGWTEGLQLLKEGGKAELYIPANLAYGENGAPPQIEPNSTLIFTVELLKIVK